MPYIIDTTKHGRLHDVTTRHAVAGRVEAEKALADANAAGDTVRFTPVTYGELLMDAGIHGRNAHGYSNAEALVRFNQWASGEAGR